MEKKGEAQQLLLMLGGNASKNIYKNILINGIKRFTKFK